MNVRETWVCGGCGAPAVLAHTKCRYCGCEYKGKVDSWRLKDGLMEPPEAFAGTAVFMAGSNVTAGDMVTCSTFDYVGSGHMWSGSITCDDISAGAITATRIEL